MANKNASNKFKPYYYYAGLEFMHLRITPSPNLRSIQLKVWEEPDPDGIYVIGVDPAYGVNEKNDRSAIQVMRCYADGLDQVAEYAWPLINTKQLAWVVAHLLGWYDNCYYIQELNGPGDSVWRELRDLKRELQRGIVSGVAVEEGIQDIFGNVRNFIYTRSDSMFAGQALQMKTTGSLKVTIMERMRDYVSNGMVSVRSLAALEEMKSIARDGDYIAAGGSNKDDRVLALAFCIHFWQEKIRPKMSQMKRTRDNEKAKRRLTVRDMNNLYTDYQMSNFFAQKRKQQSNERVAALRAQWRRR